MAFLGRSAGAGSNFAKIAGERNKCPNCGSNNTKMLDFENDTCNDCNAIYSIL